jgi:hypothetical protein
MEFRLIYQRLSLFSFLLFFSSIVLAQNTVVSGTVTDAYNRKPLPFVAVVLSGTTIGKTTDINGKYSFNVRLQVTQLKVSFLGYKTATFPVKPGQTQVINIRLVPTASQLQEVVVKSGKKPKV